MLLLQPFRRFGQAFGRFQCANDVAIDVEVYGVESDLRCGHASYTAEGRCSTLFPARLAFPAAQYRT